MIKTRHILPVLIDVAIFYLLLKKTIYRGQKLKFKLKKGQ